jgi:hypothetical protein
MGSQHEVNPHNSRRHLLHARAKPPAPTLYAGGRTYRAKGDAAYYAMRAGSPDTGYTAYRRADGTWVPVVLLRDDQWWMLEHISYCGCVAYPAAYDLPANPGDIPSLKTA